MILNCALFDELSEQARNNPRQRQNYDLRNSSEDMSQRMLNALEPCTVIPIHRHPQSSETVVLLRGSIRQNFYSIKDEEADIYQQNKSLLDNKYQVIKGEVEINGITFDLCLVISKDEQIFTDLK